MNILKSFITLFAFSTLGIFINQSIAQIDILLPPTPLEKKEVAKVLSEYQKYIQVMADTGKVNEKKSLSVKFLKDRLASANIFVFNDVDTLAKPDDLLNFFKYTQKLPEVSQGKLNFEVDTTRFYVDKVRYDKIRRYYFVEAKTTKKLIWQELRKKVEAEPIQDSSMVAIVDSASTFDTIITSFNQKITFHIKFEKENNIAKNFKIYAISKTGTPPKLEPLPPLISWWLELDQDWKDICRKKLKLDEYPREFDIEKLTGQYHLDLSGSGIKTLEPLRKFNNLEKLDFSNTAVNNLDPILHLSRLKKLDISKTKIDTLKGLEKLTSLEEFNCVGNKLKGIAEVKYLTNLKKLKCAENEIEDISPVKELLTLEELDFSLNIKVKSIDAVKDLINLTKLALMKIDVRNLEPIRNLENLVYLDLFNTNITSLEPIRNLKKVTHLSLDHNKMTSLEPIKNYRFITELSLNSSSVKDLSEIKNFNYLKVLNIANTEIVDLGPVHKFEYINVLNAAYAKVNKEEIQRFKKNHPKCRITYY